jgi:hypothetical protein
MLVYGDTHAPKGRGSAECEALLWFFYNFCQTLESAAIDAYLKKNPQLSMSKQRLIEILQHPEKRYEEEYYAVLREVFMLEEKTLEDGIRSKVGEFWEEFLIKKSRSEQEKDIQFYLSP